MVHPVAVHVGRPVVGDDRPQMRRPGARGVPLTPAVVRHADHSDRAGEPGLYRDVLDHVVDRLALGQRDRVPGPFRTAGTGNVHRDVGERLVEIELDRAVLGERENAVGRQVAQSLLVGRRGQHDRVRAVTGRRQVKVGAQEVLRASEHLDFEGRYVDVDHYRTVPVCRGLDESRLAYGLVSRRHQILVIYRTGADDLCGATFDAMGALEPVRIRQTAIRPPR